MFTVDQELLQKLLVLVKPCRIIQNTMLLMHLLIKVSAPKEINVYVYNKKTTVYLNGKNAHAKETICLVNRDRLTISLGLGYPDID